MSNIAEKKKTGPPGSWPWDKGEDAPAQAHAPLNQSATTPRSPPAVPEYKGYTVGSSVGESQNGEYTHHEPQSKGKEKEEEEQEPIKMKDVEPEPLDDKEEKQEVKDRREDLKETGDKGETVPEVEPQSERQEDRTVEEAQEAKTEQAGDDLKAPAGEDSNAELTEKAKQAFDQASENQPTNDARDSFLKSARGSLVVPQTESPRPQEDEKTVPEVEASETARDTTAEIQEKAQTEKGEGIPATEEKAQTEKGEDIPATEEKAAAETQEKPAEIEDKSAPELQEGEQQATTTAQDEVKPSDQPTEEGEGEQAKPDLTVLKDGTVNKGGNVVSPDGKLVGRVIEGEVKQLVGKKVDEDGNIWSSSGKVVGKAEPILESELEAMLKEPAPFESFPNAVVEKDGIVTSNGDIVGRVVEGDKGILRGKSVDTDGDILDKGGNVIGKAERWEPEPEPEKEPEPEVDLTVLKDGTINKAGNVVSPDGKIVGRVTEGEVKQLVGKKVDEDGNIWSSSGKVVGKAEPIPESELDAMLKEPAPFESFPDAVVEKDGIVTSNGDIVGRVIEGDKSILRGKSVDADGDILDKGGNVIGKAERWEPEPEPEPEKEPEPEVDLTVLKDGTVNKAGNVVSPNGKIVGRVAEGEVKHLVGKKVDEDGNIWSSGGKVIGKAKPISDSERDAMLSEPAPFESFPDAVVDKEGMVISNGEIVGRVIQGEKSVLRGKNVDADGDILDRGGNVIGKAERWEPEPEKEPEPEPEVDKSILAGKRVNKAGNVVDGNGTIFGRVVEGDAKRMVGRMCDKKGNILSESGDIIGRAELVSEGEREGLKEGPFAELQGCTVAKDGTIVTPAGDVVGRLTSGDPKVLFGRAVDEDGDILDKNGNTVGKAERWEPEKVEHKKNPMSGRRVNREGNVVDEDGNIIGKLTSGELSICSGKEIDDDGDVVDYKGNTVGHCSLLEDIPKEEPKEEEPKEEESPEEKEKREQAERDKKLAVQMSVCIEQCLDSIRPICKMITEKIDKAERTPEDERDEEALVKEVRPLIEEGGRILNEAKGIIKGLDPDGRISANAKHKTAAREATPEEYHLADVLKDLTGDVTQCIENGKRKLEDMPHAKKELNPLWGLLNEPLFQILAAVGLLLAGVLNLVGRLLSGLGLGGIVDGLLGTLGLNRVLEGLGLGSFSKSLKSGKKGGGLLGGGLLGGVLGG